jgi:hypothetical protein
MRSGGSLLLAVAVLLPLTLAADHFMKQYMNGLVHLITVYGLPEMGTMPKGMVEGASAMAGVSNLFLLTSILYAFGLVYVQAMSTTLSWEAASGYRPEETESYFWNRPIRFNIIQSILIVVLMGMVGLASLLLISFGWIAGAVVAALIIVGIGCVVAYFAVGTIFRLHETVVDGRGPWRGLISSMALVKGNWWRTAGVCIPFFALFFFLAVVIPTTLAPRDPVGGLEAATLTGEARQIATWFAETASAITPLYSILRGIGTPVALVLGINLLTAAYFDLRVRRGDFDEAMAGEAGQV